MSKQLIDITNTRITPRHNRDDKPAGREYLLRDDHNASKAHHIIITAEGETYYNQAILMGSERIGLVAWQDFYEWELVGCLQWHGYREYIDEAVLIHGVRIERLTKVGSSYSQADLDQEDRSGRGIQSRRRQTLPVPRGDAHPGSRADRGAHQGLPGGARPGWWPMSFRKVSKDFEEGLPDSSVLMWRYVCARKQGASPLLLRTWQRRFRRRIKKCEPRGKVAHRLKQLEVNHEQTI